MGGKGSGWKGPRDPSFVFRNQYTTGSYLWKPSDPEKARAKYQRYKDTDYVKRDQKRAKYRVKKYLQKHPRPPAPPLPPKPPPIRLQVFDPRFNAPWVTDRPPRIEGFNPPDNARIPIPVDLRKMGNDFIKGTAFDSLFDDLDRFRDDPLGFVLWAFPWGEPGTQLENQDGPEDWQREQLVRVGERLREAGLEGCVVEEDTSAGHGVGKSAIVSWMILWAISTFENTRGVVTANTDTQLRTKTWAELSKWYGLFIARQFFTLTATAIYVAGDPIREKSWRIDQIPWSKERSEAFAGLHNQGKRIIVIFDEASAIDDVIWEVTEGALTDANTQILWLRYGNPTKTSGRFFKNCTQGKRNTYTRVDSRTVTFSNKAQIAAWVEEYGEDSDFVRVRVKGQFPRAGYANFISPELVMGARKRKLDPVSYTHLTLPTNREV